MEADSLVIIEWTYLSACRRFKTGIAALRTIMMTHLMHIFLNLTRGLVMKDLPYALYSGDFPFHWRFTELNSTFNRVSLRLFCECLWSRHIYTDTHPIFFPRNMVTFSIERRRLCVKENPVVRRKSAARKTTWCEARRNHFFRHDIYSLSRVPLRHVWNCGVPPCVRSARAYSGHLPHSFISAASLRGKRNSKRVPMTRKMANACIVRPASALTGRTKPKLPPNLYGGQLCENYRALAGSAPFVC